MPGYRIKRTEVGWNFALYPRISHNQPLGVSRTYDTREQCENAIEEFKRFIKENQINTINSKYVVVNEEENFFKIIDKNGRVIFYREKPFASEYNKRNMSNSINSIYRNIDEDLIED